MTTEPLFASIIQAYQNARLEAARERKARHLRYESRLVENFNYSPHEFYGELTRNIEKRAVPGISIGLLSLAESVAGSANRLYLAVGREKLHFYICAAPFGSGFFFSWRFVDERRPAEWYHIILAFILHGAISLLLTFLFLWLLDALGLGSNLLLVFAPWILTFTLIWSLMRLASLPGNEGLAKTIEDTPILGRIFERFYRPDTYYREDTTKMYEKAFYCAMVDTIEAVTGAHGYREEVRAPESSIVDK